MALEPADIVRLSRKLGFGLRPEEDVPADFVGWASAQLQSLPTPLGVASIAKAGEAGGTQPAIVPWPAKYLRSLEDTIQRTVAFRKGMDVLEKKFDPSSPDFVDGQHALEAQYVLIPWDILRRTHQAVYGAAPVFERFVHFWANHFTVAPKEKAEYAFGHYLDGMIRPNLLKDFRSLLYDVTTHPSMQVYLDGPYSIGPHSQFGKELHARGQFADINENLGRELLELHSLSPAAGYTQDDIIGAAKILTGHGYTFELPTQFPNKERWKVFFPERHEPGKKTLLGQSFPTGKDALKQLTDFLATHDQTILHLSRKLLRYFISDNPADEDIAQLVGVWNKTDGNLPAIHQAVVEIAVARNGERKFQQPEVWLYQMLRQSGAGLFVGWDQVIFSGRDIDNFSRDADNLLRELGENYWVERQPNGYSDAAADWISPEYMERRLRFSELAFRAGNVAADADKLVEKMQATDLTRKLVGAGKSDEERFVLLFCSPEMTEA